ncbi:MAG TPA: sn-glycerol-3-phosphate ABC transporter ATP-binding protein UgpC [Thermoleophilaceae bacterium]
MAEITLKDVTKRYPDGTEAVKHMNMDIQDGEFMILVGPSGCGKSTALRMIAGLEEISEGEIDIGGERVNEFEPRDRDIAMVFQNYALYPHMTVRENMGFALKLAKVEKDEIDRRVEEAARILDLTEQHERKPANLSGGQRQRVAMGRAIVRDPAAFLMDEPLSNLDAKLRVQTRTELARLQERLGTTTIYVTHDQTEAMTLGDRVAVMRLGVVQQVGPGQELYERPVNLFVAGFIGSPSMNFLPGVVEGDRVRLPMVEVPIPEDLRGKLRDGQEVFVGVRPEDIEDAAVVGEEKRHHGVVFRTKIELLESMGAELYAHFSLGGDAGVEHEHLRELAADAGTSDVPSESDRGLAVARLDASANVPVGREAELWLDTTKLHFFDPESGRSLRAAAEELTEVPA